jgi:hypothetical protein
MQELDEALGVYFKEWNAWVKNAKEFDFSDLAPMHAGWKVSDEASLGHKMTKLLHATWQGHIGTVDNRKIALLALTQPLVGVPVLQLMQLRPDSNDPLGLDHVAFYCANMAPLVAVLEKSSYRWEHQSNPGHSWVSLWFGPSKREAKFFDHTSLDLGAGELTEASERIKQGRYVT